jgi:hypothetical protein
VLGGYCLPDDRHADLRADAVCALELRRVLLDGRHADVCAALCERVGSDEDLSAAVCSRDAGARNRQLDPADLPAAAVSDRDLR